MNLCVCLSACMSVFRESMHVYTTKQDKTEADPEKQILKRSGRALLPNCLYPVLNFPQRTQETGILLQIVVEPLYQICATAHPALYPSDLPAATSSWSNSVLSCSTEYLR